MFPSWHHNGKVTSTKWTYTLGVLMGRRGQSVTLSISDRDKAQLEQIAAEQGMLWGDRPNISRLVEAIGQTIAFERSSRRCDR
jgi:hypothetical protein